MITKIIKDINHLLSIWIHKIIVNPKLILKFIIINQFLDNKMKLAPLKAQISANIIEMKTQNLIKMKRKWTIFLKIIMMTRSVTYGIQIISSTMTFNQWQNSLQVQLIEIYTIVIVKHYWTNLNLILMNCINQYFRQEDWIRVEYRTEVEVVSGIKKWN